MRGIMQVVCVLGIALGSGLLAFSSKLEPQVNLADPASLARSMNSNSYEDRDRHFTASITGGVGLGFMILGTLGLLIPWVNKIGANLTGELGDNAARTIGIIAIWLALAIILTFGVFGVSWNGTGGLLVALLIVATLCTAVALTSAMICGWKPWIRSNLQASTIDQPKS